MREQDANSPTGRDPESDIDPGLLDLIRESGAPPLDGGAAARIAAGAWERAETLRGTAPARKLRPWQRVPRPAIAAAAALLIAVGVMSMQGSDPVFAVDGRDDVQVRDGGEWESARGVDFGQEVFAPVDARLIARDGSEIEVSRGSVIRTEPFGPATGESGIVVFVLRGNAKVSGDSIHVKSGGLHISRDEHVAHFGVQISVSSQLGADAPPTAALATPVDAEPVVSVFRGNAWIEGAGERLHLGRDQAARLVRLNGGDARRARLALVEEWSEDLPARLMEQMAVVMDARMDEGGSLGVVVGAPSDLLHIQIPSGLIRGAIADLNVMTQEVMVLRGTHGPGGPGLHARIDMTIRERPSTWAGPVAEFEHRSGDRVVRVVRMGDGSYALDTGGDEARRFADVVKFRSEAPEEAKLFGPALTR